MPILLAVAVSGCIRGCETRECESNKDCEGDGGYDRTQVCEEGKCQTRDCVWNFLLGGCELAGNRPCYGDEDCQTDERPRCNRDDGLCYTCLEDADCPNGDFCARRYHEDQRFTRYCDGCVGPADCPPERPYCLWPDPVTRRSDCGVCLQDEHCPAEHPFCYGRTCGDCRGNIDCPAERPMCDPTNGECRACSPGDAACEALCHVDMDCAPPLVCIQDGWSNNRICGNLCPLTHCRALEVCDPHGECIPTAGPAPHPGGALAAELRWVRIEGDPPFEMARAEVSLRSYHECVKADFCEPVRLDGPWGRPVTRVPWKEAARFAAFVGGRLPTFDEWSRAVHPGGQPWPWGDEPLDCAFAHYRGCRLDGLQTVCDLEESAGFCDLVGNAEEWLLDRDYAAESPYLAIGGSIDTPKDAVEAAMTPQPRPAEGSPVTGFRVVRDAPPSPPDVGPPEAGPPDAGPPDAGLPP